VLEAIARGAFGGPAAAGHALDLAEPNGPVMAFLLHPAPGLLERHTRGSRGLAHRTDAT